MSRAGAAPSDVIEEVLLQRTWLRGVARALVRSHHEAEDLAQDTVERLLGAALPPAHTPLRAWMRGVLFNLHSHHARSAVRRRQREQAVAAGEPAQSPEAFLLEGEMHRRLLAALDQLDEPFRTTLRLTYHDELNSSEVARRLQTAPATVRRRNQIALAALRERMGIAAGEPSRPQRRALVVPGFATGTPWWRRLFGRLSEVTSPVLVAATATLLVALASRHLTHGTTIAHARPAPAPPLASPWHEPGGARFAVPVMRATAGTAGLHAPNPGGAADPAQGPALPPAPAVATVAAVAAIPVACPASLQALIDAAAAGTTVYVPPCVFREQIAIDKPLTLDGGGTAELRGSDVVSGFEQTAIGWRSRDALARPACRESGRCSDAAQVFVDGQALDRAVSSPRAGEFALDGARHLVLASDPGGHVVEATVRPQWLSVVASDVTVRGFRMRHALARPGALYTGCMTRGVRIAGNVLSDSSEAAIWACGHDLRIEDNDVTRTGGPAIALLHAAFATVRGNHVSRANQDLTRPSGWHGAGIWWIVGSGVVADNDIRDGRGSGVFLIGVDGVRVLRNVIADSVGAGVIWLSSARSQTAGNRLLRNGVHALPREPGVVVTTSREISVEDNVLAEHVAGVAVRDEGAGTGACASRLGNTVNNNDLFGDGDGVITFAASAFAGGLPLRCAAAGPDNRRWPALAALHDL